MSIEIKITQYLIELRDLFLAWKAQDKNCSNYQFIIENGYEGIFKNFARVAPPFLDDPLFQDALRLLFFNAYSPKMVTYLKENKKTSDFLAEQLSLFFPLLEEWKKHKESADQIYEKRLQEKGKEFDDKYPVNPINYKSVYKNLEPAFKSKLEEYLVDPLEAFLGGNVFFPPYEDTPLIEQIYFLIYNGRINTKISKADDGSYNRIMLPSSELEKAFFLIQIWNKIKEKEAHREPKDFTRLNLEAIQAYGFRMDNANFTEAILKQSTLISCEFFEGNFSQVDFSGTNLSNSQFQKGNFTKANLTNANLKNTNFYDSNLSDVCWAGVIYTNLKMNFEKYGFDFLFQNLEAIGKEMTSQKTKEKNAFNLLAFVLKNINEKEPLEKILISLQELDSEKYAYLHRKNPLFHSQPYLVSLQNKVFTKILHSGFYTPPSYTNQP